MKKITCIFFLLVVAQSPVYAEVFKCKLASGKTAYQPVPCPPATIEQDIFEIETTNADNIAKEQAQLAAREADFIAREAAALKEEQQRHEELARQKLIEIRRLRALERAGW